MKIKYQKCKKVISKLFSIFSFYNYYKCMYISRAEIRRLTKLLNEIPSRRSSQMADLSELDEHLRESTEEPSELNTE